MSSNGGMPWVKLHTSRLNDPRLAVLDDAAQLHYFKLTLLAGELDAGGALVMNGRPLTDSEIAWRIRHDEETVKASLKTLRTAGLALRNGHGWELIGYMDEQGPTQADKRAAWRDRQNKRRGVVTSDKVTVTSDNPIVTGDCQPVTSDKANVTPQIKSKNKNRGEKKRGGGVKTPESSGALSNEKIAKPPSFAKGEPKGFKALRQAGGTNVKPS
jgi:hypothetical protein